MASTRQQGDFTGRQRDAAVKVVKEEQELRQQELTMASRAAEIQLLEETIDLTGHAPAAVDDSALELAEVALETERFKTIRVNTEIKDMTYGAGNYYSFQVGPKYKIPADVADHLDSLGYLWH